MKKIISIAVIFLAVIMVWQGCKKKEETGEIYGTVTDYATGEPVKNANVKLRPTGTTIQTGSDGTYSFQDIKPGEYSLSLSKAEYEDLDDDYVIAVSAGKRESRDVQMKKQVALLRITDMNGNDITTLDFGSEMALTSKSFNIFNETPVNITCQLSHNCDWITSVTSLSAPIASGQTVPIVVTIDRMLLAGGENSTILHINSNNGANELTIKAIGVGGASVTTANITNITANTATCGGNVTNDGGSTVTERGVCWALTPSPSIESGSHLSIGNGTGSFSGTITGLAPNTPYYVRAYATNVKGTSYGEQKTFTTSTGLPTVLTTALSNITAISATCGGNVTENGGFPVTSRGICWNTTGYPDIDDPHTSSGSGNGSFTANMTNLTPNTTYHVRAYATNSIGTTYGQDKTFTTNNGVPTVTTAAVTNITATTAQSGGSATANGGLQITAKGICWNTSGNPDVNGSHTTNGAGSGTFTANMTGLALNTTYHVRAYATTSTGSTYYGTDVPFTTKDGKPEVTTTTPTLYDTTVSTGGNVSSDGGFAVTARGICYGPLPYPDLTATYSHTTNGSGTGYYSSTFSLLGGSGTYYIRAYATNANGTSYGEQVTITHPYDSLPTFAYNGHTYRVAPDPHTSYSEYISWSAANTYCENLTAYGYTDWRMPTKEELETMYQNRLSIGGFIQYYSSSNGNHYYPLYHSSTLYPDGGYNTYHYKINFYDGSTEHTAEDGLFNHLTSTTYRMRAHIRPVRVEN